MINNEIERDERVHLNETDVIVNEGCDDAGEDKSALTNPWGQTKSDNVLQDAQTHEAKHGKSVCNKIQGAIFPVIVLGIILGLVVMLFVINNSARAKHVELDIPYTCSSGCSMSLVESIPENLTYPAGSLVHRSTYSAWKQMITSANKSIAIASMYWTLKNAETNTTSPTAHQGEDIFTELRNALKRGVLVRIAQNSDQVETSELAKLGADVRTLNVSRLLGAGILHTKFIISDNQSFYLGSANMDWRALTQVKEMGVHGDQCRCPILDDLYKIFEIYWLLGEDNSTIPRPWPEYLDSHYNMTHPLDVDLGVNDSAKVFLSSSPAAFCTTSRAVDLDAILSVMEDAKEYVYIAVMDYYPTTLYMTPVDNNIFWPDIDNKLRKIAFERNIEVRLLASYWNHTSPLMLNYLKSLKVFNDRIDVRLFVVPVYGDQANIPFSRVNHNKYMVTDRVAYIGTSNWAGDYFLDTAGVGMIFNQSESSTNMSIRNQLSEVFNRDWISEYSHSIDSQFEIVGGVVRITPP